MAVSLSVTKIVIEKRPLAYQKCVDQSHAVDGNAGDHSRQAAKHRRPVQRRPISQSTRSQNRMRNVKIGKHMKAKYVYSLLVACAAVIVAVSIAIAWSRPRIEPLFEIRYSCLQSSFDFYHGAPLSKVVEFDLADREKAHHLIYADISKPTAGRITSHTFHSGVVLIVSDGNSIRAFSIFDDCLVDRQTGEKKPIDQSIGILQKYVARVHPGSPRN